jgi:hypothetical protein
MPAKLPKKRRIRLPPIRTSEVLDVRMAAELLTVSPDTVKVNGGCPDYSPTTHP